MKINELILTNFRKYGNLRIVFTPQINIIYGSNASGKTTILEAIYMLSMAKSPRANNDNELIRFSDDSFFIKGTVVSKNSKSELSVSYSKAGKRVKKNDNLFHSLSDFVGDLNVVMFAPGDFLLFKKGPSERRTFIDLVICQLSKDYLQLLNNYRKILKERNAMLKELSLSRSKNKMALLETLTDQLAKYGEQIINYRNKIILKLNGSIQEKYRQIAGGHEKLCLAYKLSTGSASLYQILANNLNEDIIRGTTKFGPHVDDIDFLLDERNIIDFGSQGEQKSVIISLKLAFLDLIYEIKNEYPVLLLDDVFSELDGDRQNSLITTLNSGVQTIITATSLYGLDQKLISNANLVNTDKIWEMKE